MRWPWVQVPLSSVEFEAERFELLPRVAVIGHHLLMTGFEALVGGVQIAEFFLDAISLAMLFAAREEVTLPVGFTRRE